MKLPTTERAERTFNAKFTVLNFTLSGLALIVAVVAIFQSCSANKTAKKTAHFYVKPTIASVWHDPKWPIHRTNLAHIELVNRGPIDVKAFNVILRTYVFPGASTNTSWPTNVYSVWNRDRRTEASVFESELKVGGSVRASVPVSLDSPNLPPIVVGVFASYYRQTDMQEFTDSSYFFIDGNTVLGPANFPKHPKYTEMMRLIASFRPPKRAEETGLPFE